MRRCVQGQHRGAVGGATGSAAATASAPAPTSIRRDESRRAHAPHFTHLRAVADPILQDVKCGRFELHKGADRERRGLDVQVVADPGHRDRERTRSGCEEHFPVTAERENGF